MISIKKRDPLPSVFLFATYSIYKTLPQVIEQSLHLFFMKKIIPQKGSSWSVGYKELMNVDIPNSIYSNQEA